MIRNTCRIGGSVVIGYTPENNAREFAFDIRKYIAAWPECTPEMLVVRPGEDVARPVVTSVKDGQIIWSVKRYDVKKAGKGRMWVVFHGNDGETLGETPATMVSVMSGPPNIDSEEPPETEIPWVGTVLDAAKRAEDAAERAENAGGGGNGAGGIVKEVDPTVPEWAKKPNKPTYTAAEVGALPNTTVIPTVPSALPNPQPIVINGISYDGSERKEITLQAGDGGNIAETDPTVPAWAKSATKPAYTAEEVGALPNTYEAPVKSVNGKTGDVALVASDVGALPNTTVIPTVPNALKNPYPLTINGVAYDGSEAKTINIQASGGGESVSLDTTLTHYGMAADAGAVGNALEQEKQAREDAVSSLSDQITAQKEAIDEKVSTDQLNTAVNSALQTAKESGDFKGDPGQPGTPGEDGHTPEKGVDYWTEQDKAEMVNDVLAALPNASGVSF